MALGGLRRPQFHKGQYGSALGSYAPAAQLLAQAGRTQGAAMAGLGGNIAGAIEKYQLNKQERAKIMGRLDRYLTPQKRTDLVSTGVEEVDKKRQSALDKLSNQDANMKDLSYLDSLISTDIEMENQAAKQRAAAMEMLTKQQGLENMKLTAKIQQDTRKNDKLMQQIRNEREIQQGFGDQLRNRISAVQARLGEDTEHDEKIRNETTLSVLQGQLKEQIDRGRYLPGKLRDEAELRTIGKEQGYQAIEKSASDRAKDAAAEDVYSSADRAAADKKRDIATARETDARTEKLLIEVTALMEANEPINDSMLVGIEDAAILPIDIETAAGGDGVGWLTDAANWVAGVAPIAGGTGISPARIRERTNLANFQGMVLPAFLKGISTHGGKWAREDIMRMIPQEDDTNAEMRSKITQLIPHMRRKIAEAKLIYKQGTSNVSIRNTALQIRLQFPGLIKMLNQSIGDGGEGEVEEAERFLREGQ